MAANIEVIGVRKRQSFAPLVALLVLVGAIGTTYALTRSEPASSTAIQSVTSFGLGRDALVGAGYTGRLGGATLGGWRPAAHPAELTPRVGSTASLSGDGWMARAIDAGFTGRLGATSEQPSEPPYVDHQRL